MDTRRQRPYAALVSLHASLTTLRPGLTWQPKHWLAATVELRQQLPNVLRVLRVLRANPALDLADKS